MKDSKAVIPKIGLRNRLRIFEDLLNQYAREGWSIIDKAQEWSSIEFECDNNS